MLGSRFDLVCTSSNKSTGIRPGSSRQRLHLSVHVGLRSQSGVHISFVRTSGEHPQQDNDEPAKNVLSAEQQSEASPARSGRTFLANRIAQHSSMHLSGVLRRSRLDGPRVGTRATFAYFPSPQSLLSACFEIKSR